MASIQNQLKAPIQQLRNAGGQAVMVCALVFIQACSTAPRTPVPVEWVDQIELDVIPGVRYWGDEPPRQYYEWLHLDDREIQSRYKGIYGVEHNYLALSGGGPRGSFGAGLLAGWAERGDRPTFVIVSGVSTGALIAPYAFLGAQYDHVIKEVYLDHSTEDLARKKNVFAIVGGESVSDTTGFANMIEYYLTDAMIDEIGRQTRLGRDLLIGTTNLDSARPVVWNIGDIALSDHPDKYQLIRQVILASASLPVAFPPVIIPVTVNGTAYDEMHVDGGVANQVFVYPLGVDWARVAEKLHVQGRPRLYVIRNAQIKPVWAPVDRKLIAIASSSLDSIMRTQSLGDLYRIYIGTLRDDIEFNLAYIPDDFVDKSKEPVDKDTMLELYQLGQELGRNGYHWVKAPPGATTVSQPPR